MKTKGLYTHSVKADCLRFHVFQGAETKTAVCGKTFSSREKAGIELDDLTLETVTSGYEDENIDCIACLEELKKLEAAAEETAKKTEGKE